MKVMVVVVVVVVGVGGARLLRNVDKQNKNHIGFGYYYVHVYNYVKNGEEVGYAPLVVPNPMRIEVTSLLYTNDRLRNHM